MTPEKCAHCGDLLRASGRRPKKLSKRYCMQRECQAAKQRHYRNVQRGLDESGRMETRSCLTCGVELPHRPGRSTDRAFGRFCTKARCQRSRAARDAVVSAIAAGQGVDTIKLIDLFFEVSGRVECPKCGLVNAVPSYPHFDRDGGKCVGTGDFPITGPVVVKTWPEGTRRYANVE